MIDKWESIIRGNAKLTSKMIMAIQDMAHIISDAAVIRYIEELHSRCYKMMLYPTPLLDTENKEWRGKLSVTLKDISDY
ncbi:MAG: hypothetical protein ACR5K2_01155 [Wolbachia sp.]